jgi:signal transduction histidine kinase
MPRRPNTPECTPERNPRQSRPARKGALHKGVDAAVDPAIAAAELSQMPDGSETGHVIMGYCRFSRPTFRHFPDKEGMMPAQPALPTRYAPAERADASAIAADVAHFQDQELLQEFFAAVPDLFVVLNEQRQIVFANRALLAALGLATIDEVAGQRVGEALSCVHAFDGDEGPPSHCGTTEFCRNCGAVNAMLSAQRGIEDKQECRISLADGSALDLRVHARPLQLGSRCYTLFAINDISHEKRRYVLERIFFHDILNTAGGMLGVAELLRTGSPDEVADFKDTVALLANSLVDEIRAQQMLLAAERGELKLEPARLNSFTLLCEMRNTYINHDVCMGRFIEVDPTAQTVLFTSDGALVRRVLGNMIKNALEACHPGQTVMLNARACPEGIEFTVHNPGVMPPSVQLQVFQRSFSSKGDGRGLGAYSMKLLSERYLQGSVAFTSTPAAGTTFYARYPLEMEG